MNPAPAPGSPDELLAQSAAMLAPLVRLLMAQGVDHPRLAAALKRVYVDAALQGLRDAGDDAPTHTAVSLRTGLQRRDVKALREAGADGWPAKARAPTLAMQAVARWAHEPPWCDDAGRPRALPLRGGDPAQPSFEQLADSLSKDVHPPALRDELVRLGLARDDDGLLTLLSAEFVPVRDASAMVGALTRNVHDHLAAAAANVLAGQRRFLEYSLVADELAPASVQELHTLAGRLWSAAYRKGVQAATEHVARDRAAGFDATRPEMRMRFGVYFYSEPVRREGPR